MNNRMELRFDALAENEAFSRMVISAFLVQVNPTMSIVSEVRTAVSEAVTNAIVHGYAGTTGTVVLRAQIEGNQAVIEVEDYGCGIADVQKAMEPLFTTGGSKRAGLGFAIMQELMDEVRVTSRVGGGTTVRLRRRLSQKTR